MFGEKIKELCKRDGRKQEDLAIALGVTNQAISRWKSNGGYPVRRSQTITGDAVKTNVIGL
ncbi:MAG: helix-turn-helix transcriptional regulator [Eubacteriales bacterium]